MVWCRGQEVCCLFLDSGVGVQGLGQWWGQGSLLVLLSVCDGGHGPLAFVDVADAGPLAVCRLLPQCHLVATARSALVIVTHTRRKTNTHDHTHADIPTLTETLKTLQW